MNTFFIAEVGVNHNGSLKRALDMIDVARDCGADAVKFQTFNAKKLVVRGAEKAEYQKKNTTSGDQYSMLAELEMSEEMHLKIVEHCKNVGIEFMSTPFDEDALHFLISIGMSRIKVSSAEITNHPFLEVIAKCNLPIILSTGMSTLSEVIDAASVILATRDALNYKKPLKEVLSVLHCTSNYPTPIQDVNLRAMLTIKNALDLSVGYSDHTEGAFVALLAVMMGATIIEKHFTLDRSLPGPDHKASLEPIELKSMIQQIRDIEVALGAPEKMPSKSELLVQKVVRRSIVLERNMLAGEQIKRSDISFLRPGTGIQPSDLKKVINRKLLSSLPAGSILEWSDLD